MQNHWHDGEPAGGGVVAPVPPEQEGRCEGVPSPRISDALCRQLLVAVEQSPVAMAISDPAGRIEFANQRYLDNTGSPREEVLGQTFTFFEPGRRDNAFYHRLWQALRETGQWQGEIWHRNRQGATYPLWQSITVVRDEWGEVSNYVAVFHGIRERNGMEQAPERRAIRDDLTGAFNRRAFDAALCHSVHQAEQEGHGVGLLLLDIDHFHVVNGRYGQGMGDEILSRLVERIGKNLRSTDLLARWGGDQFTILLPDTPLQGAATLAERLRRQVADRRMRGLSLTVSLGITAYRPGDSAEGLMDRAGEALIRAKKAGRNGVVVQ